MVYGLCRRLTPDPDDAYQEIWAKVLAALPRFNLGGTASVRTWIGTIARRHLIDRHRRRTVRGEVVPLREDALPDDAPGADARLAQRRRAVRLEAALARLPDAQRRVVVLHHLQSVALADIAKDEGASIGTIKSRLHRGRGRLAELLGGSS
jgi:RNA polymerase sigma-70 factor, ECF subfamily